MNRTFYRCSIILLALLLLLAWASTYAQTATAEIVGRVTDLHGAVIVAAKITATETATGMKRTTATNEEGTYQVSGLPPGNYELSAEAPNMGAGTAKVEVLLGAHLPVNFIMRPGTTMTAVEVTGEVAAIETTNSEVKSNIDPRQMADMPLNGRTFASLAILAPEVRPVGAFDPTKSRIGTVSFGGSTGRNFNLTVDGGDNKDNIVGGFLQNYTTEGIQEFVIDTHRFAADTGKSGGGVVNIATKGGSNTLHGGAFFFLRNRNIESADFFTKNPNAYDANGQLVPCPPCFTGPAMKKAPFDRQNYGGSFSGPLKKDKLFFFGAVEHTHEMKSIIQQPDALQSLQDFVALRKVAPLHFPELQNLPVDLSTNLPNPFLDTQFQGRMDWNLNSKNQMFFRYAQQNNILRNDQITGWSDISQGATVTNDLNSMLVNWTSTISPTLLNQFSFQYSHFFNDMSANSVGKNVTELCFNGGACIGMNENVPQSTTQNKFQFRNDLSWSKGKHTFKFGAQNIWTKDVGGTLGYDLSPWVYLRCSPAEILSNIKNGADPDICNGATSLESPGVVRSVGLAGGELSYMQHNIQQLSYYVQDDWKLTPRLTLNLGVRNDIDFSLVPTSNQVNNRAVKFLKSLNMDPGLPSLDWNNWAPRVGFAWDVTGKGKWVLRGGYGLFYDQLFTNTILYATQMANPSVFSVLYQPPSYKGDNTGVGVTTALNQVIAAVGMWPITNLPELPYGSRGRYIDHNFQTPFTQQMTVGTQIELSKTMTLAVDYVHSLGLHEFGARDINPAVDGSARSRILNPQMDPIYGCRNPDDGGSISVANCSLGSSRIQHRLARVQEINSTSRSRYDSLTFEFKRRMSKRFQFGASYVLSRALGYGGQGFDYGNSGQGVLPGLAGWQTQLVGMIGPQNFGYLSEDERHRGVINGIVELPGGFTVSGIVQLSSGRPYTMYSDDDNNGDGIYNDVYSNIITGDPTYDPGWAGDARYSLRSKNQLRGDPYYQTDLRVQKAFKFGERFKVTLLADIFNVFNRVNFGNNFANYADSLGAHQVDVPTTVYDCLNAAGSSVAPPCTYPTAKQLPRIPNGLFGASYGGAVGIPFQAQFGLRINF